MKVLHVNKQTINLFSIVCASCAFLAKKKIFFFDDSIYQASIRNFNTRNSLQFSQLY